MVMKTKRISSRRRGTDAGVDAAVENAVVILLSDIY